VHAAAKQRDQRPGDGEDPRELRRDLRALRDTYAASFTRPIRATRSTCPKAEREAFYEKLYQLPGFAFWQGNFRDILTNRAANDTITQFVIQKIRARVKDPKVADLLIPRDHGYGTRGYRSRAGTTRFYNQPNVKLVDLRVNADRARHAHGSLHE